MDLSKAKDFHYEHIFLRPPRKNPLEKVPWSKMIESCRKQDFLIYKGGVRYKFLCQSRAQKSILDWN